MAQPLLIGRAHGDRPAALAFGHQPQCDRARRGRRRCSCSACPSGRRRRSAGRLLAGGERQGATPAKARCGLSRAAVRAASRRTGCPDHPRARPSHRHSVDVSSVIWRCSQAAGSLQARSSAPVRSSARTVIRLRAAKAPPAGSRRSHRRRHVRRGRADQAELRRDGEAGAKILRRAAGSATATAGAPARASAAQAARATLFGPQDLHTLTTRSRRLATCAAWSASSHRAGRRSRDPDRRAGALDMAARGTWPKAGEHLHHARQRGGLGIRMDGEAKGGGHGT